MSEENGTVENTPAEEAAVEQTPTEQSEQSEQTQEDVEYVRDPILETEEMRKVFVGGISAEATDEELKEFFETMSGGKVTEVLVIRKESDKTKKSLFGFVTFETSENVDDLLLKREQLKFKERTLDVNRAVPKNNTTAGAREKTKKLFIANLPKLNCSEEDLKKYFDARHPKKYGIIETIQLIKKKDESGAKLEENKGYGFVNVSNEDMADKMAIQHATFEFGGRKIELKKSVPTSEGGGRGGRGGGRRGGGAGAGHQGYPYYGGGYDDWGGYGAYGGGGYGGGGYGGYGPGYGGGYQGYGGGYAPHGGRGGRGGGQRYKPY